MPLRCLGSGQEGLLDGSKDPPKTASAVYVPFRPPTQEAYLTAKTAQDAPNTASRQDAPRMPQEASKRLQDTAKMPQDASKIRFGCLFGT